MTARDSDNELVHMLAAILSVGIGEGSVSANSDRCTQHNFQSLVGCNYDSFGFSCPALSLVHDDHLNFNHDNASEAERSASELLSRSMGFKVSTGSSALDELVDVSKVLLNNVSESFALFVDSRLRAHAEFLARHGRLTAKKNFAGSSSFELLDRKLHTLLELGNRVIASKVETNFEVVEEHDCEAAITFQASMKLLFVDTLDGALDSSLTVRFEAKGSLFVSRDPKELKLALKIDTKELLTQMKQQASQVVAQVVNLTNSYFVISEPTFHRGESHLVMPPLPAPENAAEKSGPGTTTTNMALVSPDVSAALEVRDVPLLVLNGVEVNDGEDSDTSNLSPDQCEDILDDVFGDIDVAIFSAVPDAYSCRPAKKPRTCE